jgi:hypothetical protein
MGDDCDMKKKGRELIIEEKERSKFISYRFPF